MPMPRSLVGSSPGETLYSMECITFDADGPPWPGRRVRRVHCRACEEKCGCQHWWGGSEQRGSRLNEPTLVAIRYVYARQALADAARPHLLDLLDDLLNRQHAPGQVTAVACPSLAGNTWDPAPEGQCAKKLSCQMSSPFKPAYGSTMQLVCDGEVTYGVLNSVGEE